MPGRVVLTHTQILPFADSAPQPRPLSLQRTVDAVMEGRSTRSRVTLPDDILQLPQESPLKKARSDMRSKLDTKNPSSPTQPTQHDDESEEDDDELLLSPQKMDLSLTRSKRSVSPPPLDEYSNASPSEEGRELKRLKRDLSSDADQVKPSRKPRSAQRLPSHTRNFSDSNALPSKRSKSSRVLSKKPNSTGSRPFPARESSPSPDSGRAKSVPLLFSTSLPQIDLRHPPPSPTRARARSTSKEPTPKLRICPLPMVTSPLESIPDEPSAPMDVDSGNAPNASTTKDSTPPADEAACENRASTPTDKPTEPELSSPKVKFSEEINSRIIETPAVTAGPIDLDLSPLTPLPETPHPSKLSEETKAGVELEEEEIDPGAPIQALKIPPPTKTTTQPAKKASLLPRPSTSNLGAIARLEPKPGSSNPARQQSKIVIPGSQKQGANAFLRIMNLDKGTAKATTAVQGKEAQAKFKRLGKPTTSIFEQSSSKPVNRIKSAMKPKGKSTAPAPAPALVPIPVDEEDAATELAEAGPVSGENLPMDATLNHEEATEGTGTPRSQPVGKLPVSADAERDVAIESVGRVGSNDSELLKASGASKSPAGEQSGIDVPDGCNASEESPNTDPFNAIQTVEITTIDTAETEPQTAPSAVADSDARSRRQSKLPRLPSTVSGTSRTTRSTSTKKGKVAERPPETAKATKPRAKPMKRTVSGTAKTEDPVPQAELPEPNSMVQTATDEKEPPAGSESLPLAPGSPMKLSSPVRPSPRITASKSSPVKTPAATPSKSRIPVKPAPNSSPSPTKLVRSASMFSRPVSENRFNSGGSTLSTLSSALEKLRMPAPSRPNTSMGFNRDLSVDDDSVIPSGSRIQDDSNVGIKSSSGTQSTSKEAPPAVSRSNTLGSNHFLSKGKAPAAGGSKQLKQSTLLFPKGGGLMRGKPALGGFGKAPKASRNPGLPTVIGSPVKGGRAPAPMDEDEEELVEVFKSNVEEDNPLLSPTNSNVTEDKGKSKARSKDDFSSRRASVVSHLLSQSLQSMSSESTSGKGLMGPPPVPANISARSSSSNNSPGSAECESSTPPGRRSTRIAAVAANQAMAAASGSKKTSDAEKPVVNEALKFLKDCTIYVDVKTEKGEEAGSLFVQMLENVGARVLQRVGQSCTHIVYKNGMQSTINRYKALRDPKPLVVGIRWVVESVEQRKKVEEEEYLIDLDEVSLLTNPNKRRRSMLPKMISRQPSDLSMTSDHGKDEPNDGDVSMESASSTVLDDLPPLERARRRKSMLPV